MNLISGLSRKCHVAWLLLVFAASAAQATCSDELIETAKYPDGSVPYILTSENAHPKFAVILMPGGAGLLNPEMRNGKLRFGFGGNFLIRSRTLFCDPNFAAVSTNSTSSPERMLALVSDVRQRFPAAKICIIGTSRSTLSTMDLSEHLDGKVDCFVHTSSMSAIAQLDTRKFKSRHLLVHHKQDGCRKTGFYSAQNNHESFNTPLFVMEGGISQGDPCEAFAYHGYNGIENETVDKIKAWIRQ